LKAARDAKVHKPLLIERKQEEFEETPYIIALLCYLSYVILTIFGHLRDFMRNTGLEKNKSAVEKNREVRTYWLSSSLYNTCCLLGLRSAISKFRELLHAKCISENLSRLESTYR